MARSTEQLFMWRVSMFDYRVPMASVGVTRLFSANELLRLTRSE